MSQFAMPKIHLLDTLTANQIAAGEVVERPASVVKELVENSIDAGATRIFVKVLDANGEHIQVADNGMGMVPEDMVRAIKRHATSKIRQVEDLDTLSSLGFRGEALPSIASVSRMKISSATAQAISGYRISVLDGKASIPEECAMAAGTIVEVEDLFYNTPARRKFLRSPAYELGQISELMTKLALSHPQIAFTLELDGRTALATNGNGKVESVMLAVYGRQTLSQMVGVNWIENMLIYGMASLPVLNRANRSQYNFFVNGRWVRSKELSLAVDEAYATLLPKQRYPLVCLYLSVPPATLDVNVHPGKLEIKLKEAPLVQESLKAALAAALQNRSRLTPSFGSGASNQPLGGGDGGAFRLGETSKHKKANKEAAKESAFLGGRSESRKPGGLYQALYAEKTDFSSPAKTNEPLPRPAATPPLPPQAPESPFRYTSLRPMGQLDSTYIIAEGEDGLYLIDQHAAHERILYEDFKKKSQAERAASQPLAVPVTLELSHQESALLVEAVLALHDLGFVLEHFGDNTFILRAVPAWYQGTTPEDLIFDVLNQTERKGGATVALPREEELFLRACKSAVKAYQALTEADIANLLARLDACENPSTCPHGRPVAVKISLAEIRRKFLRTGI